MGCLTEPKSSSDRVENGPTVSLTGRCDRSMTKDTDRWTLVGSWYHWPKYAPRHTAALCGFTNTGTLTSSQRLRQLLRTYSVGENGHRWNGTDRGNPKSWKKYRTYCYLVQYKYLIEFPRIEHGPPW